MSPSETEQLLDGLDATEKEDFWYDWFGEAEWFEGWARDKQRPPDGDWFIWLILAGRGFGKTRAGAEWVIERAKQEMGPIALVGETAADVRDTMVELGDSSILKISPPSFSPKYEPSKRRLTWPNGVTATTFSGDKPDQLRGPQHATVWADEPAKWKYPREAWDNMEFGLRLSSDPRCVATTTPRPIDLIEELVEDEDVSTTKGTTYENIAHLSDRFRKRLINKYEGTRLGRQELHAEVLSDNPGALWSHDEIGHAKEHPSLQRIVVGVDPSGGGNDIGIVTAGVGTDGYGYVLADDTLNASPMGWAKQAATAYRTHEADRIVAERNFGGDMVKSNIQSVDESLPVKVVTASRGKQQRAEPVASLYEQDRVLHVGSHPKLEDEMTTWDPDESDWSPNRCLVAGTLIRTAQGEKPIEDITPSDMVLTRKGYRPVVESAKTGEKCRVVRANLSNGRSLVGTPDHPIYHCEKGFSRLDSLPWDVRLYSSDECIHHYYESGQWPIPSTPFRLSTKGQSTSDNPTLTNDPIGSIIGQQLGEKVTKRRYTAKSGRTTMGRKFQTGASSITRTRTLSIMHPTTWSASRGSSMLKSMKRNCDGMGWRTTLMIFDRLLRNGTRVKRGRNGTVSMRKRCGRSGMIERWYASNATKNTRRYHGTGTNDSVLQPAGPDGGKSTARITKSVNARCAVRNSKSDVTNNSRIAPVSVRGLHDAGRADVYNIKVAGMPEYFANGVLVHNCDALVWALTELMLNETQKTPGIVY